MLFLFLVMFSFTQSDINFSAEKRFVKRLTYDIALLLSTTFYPKSR